MHSITGKRSRPAACFLIQSLIALFASAAALGASSPDYTYKLVAKSDQRFDRVKQGRISDPFLNDNGDVLFVGFYPGVPVCVGTTLFCISNALYTNGRVLVHTRQVIDGIELADIGPGKTNDSGEIVFYAAFTGANNSAANGLFHPHRKVVVPGDVIDGLTIQGVSTVFDLNDSGEIVFAASYTAQDGTNGSGIFTPHRLVAKSGDTLGGVTLLSVFSPAISKSGTIAFSGNWLVGNQAVNGVFTGHGAVVKQGDQVDGYTLMNPGLTVAITELGEIAFSSGTTGPNGFGPSGYFTKNSIIAKDGDVIDGQKLALTTAFDSVHLNASGEAVFIGYYGDSVYNTKLGLFTKTHLIASAGDTIEGVLVYQLAAPAVINDSGQIAFVAFYTDPASDSGGWALFVATPK